MNGEKNNSVRRVCSIAAIVIVVLQILFFIAIFVTKKNAYHEDEFFSYALANSYDRPFIYGSAHQVMDNYNVWMTGDDFKYYIQTNEDTRFSYGSVWRNQAADVHPPLYYAVIHTISSFFPNQFSWWWGFCVNLVCFAVMQLFLYKFVNRLTGSGIVGVVACTYWGFSLAGQGCVMFIRMYMMLTMFGVMYAYLSQTVLTCKERLSIRQYIFVGAVAFLGALTHHYFLVFAFVYTLVMCIVLLIKRRVGRCFAYGGSAAVGVGLSIAVFPATVSHALFREIIWTGEIFPDIQRYQYFRVLLANITGYVMNYYELNYYADIIAVFVGVLVVFAAFCFLCRKEAWFIKALEKCKGNIKAVLSGIKKADLSPLIIIAASVAVFETVVHKVYLYDVQQDLIRYFYIFLPLLAGVAIAWIYFAVKHIISDMSHIYIYIYTCDIRFARRIAALSEYKARSELYNKRYS